jgi:hypothetical protein
MKYTVETAETIAQRLRELPAIVRKERDLNRREIVSLLVGEIETLEERGYTIDDIAEYIRQGGLDITTQTLKNYVQRARREQAAKGTAQGGRKKGAGGPRPRRPASETRKESPAQPHIALDDEPTQPGDNAPAKSEETPGAGHRT